MPAISSMRSCLFSILNLFTLSPVAVSQYNVSDFSSYSPSSWSAANSVKALGLGSKVAVSEFWNRHTWTPTMYPNIRQGAEVHHWSMWAGLAWANNTIYANSGANKVGLEMAFFDVATYLTLSKYTSNIVFDPTIYAYKYFQFITEGQAYHLWTPMLEHAFMAERNTYGAGNPVLFATGIEYIALIEIVDNSAVTDAASVISLAYADPWVRNSKAGGDAPFAVNRVFLAEPAADSYLVLFTEVMEYSTFNAHFCSEYPSQFIRARMLDRIAFHNADSNKAFAFDFASTILAQPTTLQSLSIKLFLMHAVYNRANVNVDLFYGCFPGAWAYFSFYYMFTFLNPGKIWYTSQLSGCGEYFYDLGSDFDNTAAIMQKDTFAVFMHDYTINAETSYASFCDWFVPQATPTTLPWTFDYLNNTMPEIQWFSYFRGTFVVPQFFAYRNGLCSGQKSADFFGDYAEMFYPYESPFARFAETNSLWTTLMDITFYMLWGHQQASNGAAGTYTLSDWYTALDGTPGFGFLTNFNPGGQDTYSTRLRFSSAFRTQCTIFYSGSARISNRLFAVVEFMPNGSHVTSKGAMVQPAFCMDANPPTKKLDCTPGTFFDFFWGLCLDCKPGFQAPNVGMTACTACPAGEFSSFGLANCQLCARGKYQSAQQMTMCDDCMVGEFSPVGGRSQCESCSAGMFADKAGMSLCENCQIGRYQDAVTSTSCKECPNAGTTTLDGILSTDVADCLCIERYYNIETWDSSNVVQCKSCAPWPTTVSVCAGLTNESKVLIRPGFMSIQGRTIVYRCEGKGSACPFESDLGGVACPSEAEQSDNIACAKCKNEYQWDAVESKCVECDEASIAMVFIAAFVIAGIIFRLRPKASTFVGKQLLDMIAFTNLSVPVQQLFDFIQFGMVLGMASIAWPDNVRTFLKRLGSIMDINMYSLECKMSGSSKDAYPFAYVILLNMMPIMFITAITVLCLPNAISKKMKELRMPSPILGTNLIFSLTSALFMTIFNFAVSLCFQTYVHPQLENTTADSSLVAFPYLLITDSTVKGMRVFSAMCICVWSVCFVAIPLMIVWISPNIRSQRNFRRCTVSLLMKYKDETSWWISVELTAKVCVVLAVNIFHDPAWQYRWLGLTLVIQTCGVLVVWPYRLAKHNLGECVISLSKVCVLASGLTLFDPDLEKSDALYFVICFFAVSCLALEFIMCLIDFLRNKVEAYPNDAAQLDSVRSGLRMALPRDYSSNERALTKLRELKYSWSKVPGNTRLADASMHSSNQEDVIASFKSREKEAVGKLSLKIKQSEVLWTIALHYQANVPGLYARCAEIKEIQTALYNALKGVLSKESDEQIDVVVVTEYLAKHEDQLKELKGMLERPGEQPAMTNEV